LPVPFASKNVPNSPIKQYGHRIVTSLFHYFGLPGTLCDAQQFFNTSDETASLPFYRVLPLLELNENLMKKGSSLPFLSSNIVRRISDSSGEGMSKLSSLAEIGPHAVWQYGLAVVSVTVALGITDWLEPYTTLRTPLFYIAIISSAWCGGMGPGLLAVVLSTLAVGYYFAPGGQTPVLSLDTLPFLLLFSLSGLIACWISVKRRRAEEALKRVRDELEVRVEERTSDLRRASEGLKAEIAERKRGEKALREKANLLDLTHDTIFVRDANNVITFWNRGAERLYGWKKEEAVGQISHHLMQTIFPAPLEKIMVELNSTGHWEGELIHALRDGTEVVVASRWALQLDERGQPIAILETNNDITERKRAEEALHRAQTELAHVTRVATLGEMTASIAHEVNQPLGEVVNNASACLRRRRWRLSRTCLVRLRTTSASHSARWSITPVPVCAGWRAKLPISRKPGSLPRSSLQTAIEPAKISAGFVRSARKLRRRRTGSTSTKRYLKSSPWRAAKRKEIASLCRLNCQMTCRSFWEIESNCSK